MITTVINLATGEKKDYTCSPRQAVIAAYAQDHNDWNTWDYEKRYGQLVESSQHTWLVGDWTTRKEQADPHA